VPSATIGARALAALDLTGVRLICLSYLDSGSVAHARYLKMRLRRRAPNIPILVGFWVPSGSTLDDLDVIAARIGADAFVTSLVDMMAEVERRCGSEPRSVESHAAPARAREAAGASSAVLR
jgi:hypothetical protein